MRMKDWMASLEGWHRKNRDLQKAGKKPKKMIVISDVPINTCADFFVGMLIYYPSVKVLTEIVSEGNWIIENGKRVSIDSPRKNKWYVTSMGSRLVLYCFDRVPCMTRWSMDRWLDHLKRHPELIP
jgi:hypothetical protein